jgi:GTP-binding protein Era
MEAVRRYIPPDKITSPRSLNVAVVGAPNSGKSTLVNYLTKHKVSAVSPKYNTTRDRVLGIYTNGNTQIVYTDTPGFVPASGDGSSRYVASLVTAAAESIPLSDVVLFVVDAARRWDDEQANALRNVAALCQDSKVGLFMVPNKTDLLRGVNVSKQRADALRAELLSNRANAGKPRGTLPLHVDWDHPLPAATSSDPVPDAAPDMVVEQAPIVAPASQRHNLSPLQTKLELLMEAFESKCFEANLIDAAGFDAPAGNKHAVSSLYRFVKPMFPVCAMSGEGVDELRSALHKLCIPREWEYGKEMVTDRSDLERTVEIIREKLFTHLHQEVPYLVRQLNRSWRKNEAGDLIIEHDLLVPRQGVASMLLARGKGALKAISIAAIKDLEAEFGCKVHLFLHVSVKPGLSKAASGQTEAVQDTR